MAETQQTFEAVADDGPEIGIELDERTHFAHARYAAAETAGVIFYDPRSGLERLSFENIPADDDLEVGEKCYTSLKIYPHRARSRPANAEQAFALECHYARREEHEKPGKTTDSYEIVHSYSDSDVYESLYAARTAACERFEEYDKAEYRDAVAFRLGGES